MTKLKLAKDLSLPLDAVTQTFLVVGKRGSGKSNTAARFVEQLHHARLPFVVLDPVDTWWGLKASRDGGKGLDVYVFGGRKADLPLEAGGGALIADVLCEHRLSMVLSVKHLSGRERSAFMVAFATTLFQKWGGGPLHVVLEEAHELAPQMAGSRGQNTDNEAAMLGAFKRLWKLGRASGIGGTAVTQRPASLSKDITTQSEILIAHRTIGPQDVRAIGEWVKYHGQHEQILGDLPSLPTGQAFVWAPEFPEGEALGLRRATILLRDTYDSASTPKVGERVVEPKELAPVDIERLRNKMAATIEKAKADDPRELRKQIAELKRQVEQQGKQSVETATIRQVKDRAVLTDADRELLTKFVERLGKRPEEVAAKTEQMLNDCIQRANDAMAESFHWWTARANQDRVEFERLLESKGFQKILAKLAAVQPAAAAQPRHQPPPAPPIRGRQPSSAPPDRGSRTGSLPRNGGTDDTRLPPGEHATLTAALQYPDGLDRKRLGILTGYKRSSRDAYIVRLQQKGLVTTNGALLYPTDAGRAALNGSFEPLPTGAALVEYWRARLPDGERKTLDVLLDANGEDVERERIDEATEYKRSSRDAYLVRLKARGLVEFSGRGTVRASAELFT